MVALVGGDKSVARWDMGEQGKAVVVECELAKHDGDPGGGDDERVGAPDHPCHICWSETPCLVHVPREPGACTAVPLLPVLCERSSIQDAQPCLPSQEQL